MIPGEQSTVAPPPFGLAHKARRWPRAWTSSVTLFRRDRMVKKLSCLIVLALAGPAAAPAAPKPADPATEKRDKAVREFVAKVYDALGRQNFDAFVELCDVPFLIQSGVEKHGDVSLLKDKASIKKHLSEGPGVPPKFDGSKHAVRSIQTYKEA